MSFSTGNSSTFRPGWRWLEGRDGAESCGWSVGAVRGDGRWIGTRCADIAGRSGMSAVEVEEKIDGRWGVRETTEGHHTRVRINVEMPPPSDVSGLDGQTGKRNVVKGLEFEPRTSLTRISWIEI